MFCLNTTSISFHRTLTLIPLGSALLIASVAHADLNVDDSLNRYSLYGKSSLKLDFRDVTSAGGWVGSDVVVTMLGEDTVQSHLTSSGNLQLGNGSNLIWDKTQVAGNVTGGGFHETFDSAMYVGGSMDMQDVNAFNGGLWIGTGPITVPTWARANSFAGTPFANPANLGTLTSGTAIAGVHWGTDPRQNPYHAWTMPDTTFNVSGRNIATAGAAGTTWSCGSNFGANLVAAGTCSASDSILPPGEYGDLSIRFGTTLYLGEGVYTFNSVTLQNAAAGFPTRLLAVQPNGARTVVLIKKDLVNSASGVKNVIAPEKYKLGYGTDSAHFAGGTLFLLAHSDITLDVELQIWATVVAPLNTVTLADRVSLFGQILANKIEVLNDFHGTDGAFIPFFRQRPTIIANFGWTGLEGALGDVTPAVITLKMDHVNGLPVKVWYHTVTPTRDTTIGGKLFKPAFPGDYDSLPAVHAGAVTIPSTFTSASFSFGIHGNDIHQPNRYFLVILDSVENGGLDRSNLWNGMVAGGGFILDDDPTPTIRAQGFAATEGTGPGTKTFKFFVSLLDSATGTPLLPSLSGGADFTWSTVNGTANATDFLPATNKSVHWPVGKNSDTLTVQVYQDSTFELDETFGIKITPSAGGTLEVLSKWAQPTATDTILNDDRPSTLSVANAPPVFEGGIARFIASLSLRSALPACFDWTTRDSTAHAGKNYTASSGTGLCIPAGVLSDTFYVPTLKDNIYMGTQFFQVVVTPKSGITVAGSRLTALGTILDLDPRPRLVIRDTSLQRPPSGWKTMKFAVTILDSATGKVPTAIGVPAIYSWKTVAGTALADTDFVMASGIDTLFPGSTRDSISIQIRGDARYHPPLSFTVVLTPSNSVATKVSRLTAVGTIFSAVGRPIIHVEDDSLTEGDLGRKPFPFSISLRDSASGATVLSRVAMPFSWTTTGKTGIQGVDFIPQNGSASIPAGASQLVVVTDSVIGNLWHQSDRTLALHVATSGTDWQPGTATAQGSILDDDPAPLVYLDTVKAVRDTVFGSRTPVWFHVRLIDPRNGLPTHSGLAVSMNWMTIDSTAKAGLDYLADSGTLTVKSGSLLDSFSVTILGDTRYSPSNAFKVVLDHLVGATSGDSIGVGSLSGGARKPKVVLVGGSVARPGQLGATSPLPFTYYLVDRLTGQKTSSRGAIDFHWSTLDSSAKAGVDYIAMYNGHSSLLARAPIDSFQVLALGLGVYAPPRLVGAEIDPLDTTWLVGSSSFAFGTIYDSLSQAGSFVTRDTQVSEAVAGGIVKVVVRLLAPTTQTVHLGIAVDSTGTTAKLNTDFRLLDDTAVFQPGDTLDTLRVQLLHDSVYSAVLKLKLRLLPNLLEKVGVANPHEVTISILDAGPAPRLAFQDSLLRVRESDTTLNIVLLLDRPSALPVAGNLVVLGGSARLGVDYQIGSGGFVFPALATRATVTVQILNDHRYGPNRDIVLGWGAVADSAHVGFDPARSHERIEILESDPRPILAFAQDSMVVQDVQGGVDLRVILNLLSDSVALADLVLDTSRGAAKGIGMVPDSSYGIRIDTQSIETSFHLIFGNDGKAGADRIVHLVLRRPRGSVLGKDSVLVIVIRNTNQLPIVKILTPVDSIHTSNPHQNIEWTVGGVAQTPSDTLLHEGWNTITRCFTDTAGNTACDTHHIWGDFTPPAIKVFKITGPNTHDSLQDTTWWGNRARTRYGRDTIWYWVRDSIRNPDNSWRVLVDTHRVVTNFWGDGSFPTEVRACDSVGNCAVDTGWIDLKQSLPLLTINTPPNGSHVPAGVIPVGWTIIDAGRSWPGSDVQVLGQVGTATVVRCYTDDVGNTGCDTTRIVVEPIAVVRSFYLDLNGDGRVDAAVVELNSHWTGSVLPTFDFHWGDTLRSGNTPDASHPFYAGPARGHLVVVGSDSFNVDVGPYLTDSVGHPLMGPDGKPLTGILGDTARDADGLVMRDSLGRILFKVPGNGVVDSTRFLVPINPPFAFGLTGFDSLQKAIMFTPWSQKDSLGKLVKHIAIDSFRVGEKVPPVIVRSEIHRVENYTDPDTLFVTPSEPLRLGAGRDWLQVGRCPAGVKVCKDADLVWTNVPDSLVTKGSDGRYWFLVYPESLSIRPDYRIRFRSDVSDLHGNGVDTANLHWATVISGPPRPAIVEMFPPTRIPAIPSSEAKVVRSGGILIRATKGPGGPSTLAWWEPGLGYNVPASDVNAICPVLEYCNGPTVYINRPVRLLLYIYDRVGTFVTHRTVDISQQDIDAMEPDQLDRLSIELEWNHRTNDGHMVSSGIYLWRIVTYLMVDGRPLPAMTNQLFKVGVKIQ